MPVTDTLAFEKLLLPIAAENPAGELLRYEGTYDRIQEARREDEPSLEQGIWQIDLKKADWNAVNQLCLEALERRSKDLQLAAWLLESWVHLYGLQGAREGLHMLGALCRGFWEVMYPALEDPEYRLAVIEWMDTKVSLQLKFIHITDPPQTGGDSPYCWADWEAACRLDQVARQRPGMKKGEARVTLEMFNQSAMQSSVSFFQCLSDDVAGTLEACAGLENFFDQVYSKDAPSMRSFRQILESIQAFARQSVRDRKSSPVADVTEGLDRVRTQVQDAERETVLLPAGFSVHNRTEAYQMLAEAAEYLFRSEPHSPVPYLVKRAVSWGGMTLEELLPEIVRNGDTLADTLKLLQIDAASQNHHSVAKRP